jgi:hypothetical protein
VVATTKILTVPIGDLGALLVGVGAVLLLIDAVGGPGVATMSVRGTMPTPGRRFSAGAEIAGALLVSTGSALLLAASHGLTVLAVVVVVATAALMIFIVMTVRLHGHMELLARLHDDEPHRSWFWCFMHPLWRSPRDS